MSFDLEENRRYGAEPVECYFFELGTGLAITTWAYTSAEESITIPGWTKPFEPAPIVARHEEYGAEDSAGGIVLTVPRALPCIAEFVAYTPTTRLKLTVIQLHRTDPIDELTTFRGFVVKVGWEENGVATLTCRPITHEFGRLVPRVAYQRQCNWPLYSAGCGVALGIWEATVVVQTISGKVISGAQFGFLSDDIYRAGFILWGSQRRFIMLKLGVDVTLMSPFIGLTPGQTVSVYAGCDGTEDVCAGRFDNLDRHLGFARVPYRNPHTRRGF